MSKYQRTKGHSFERWVVRKLNESELNARRNLEYQEDSKGDVIVGGVIKCSCKVGKQVPIWLYKARENEEEWLICKHDRKKPLIVMDLDYFLRRYA